MIRVSDILQWATGFLAQADDGFLAEMVFLCRADGVHNWPGLYTMRFASPMWETFAHCLYPEIFAATWTYQGPYPTHYQEQQALAVDALIKGAEYQAIVGDEDHNTACHKVIWANRFGKAYGELREARPIVDRGWRRDATNNEVAMSALSYALMRIPFDKFRVSKILDQPGITPENYHEMLAALLALKLERTIL